MYLQRKKHKKYFHFILFAEIRDQYFTRNSYQSFLLSAVADVDGL